MWIAGAERGLGARLIAKWSVDAEWGWRSLRNEKPRMGVRGSLGVDGGDDWPTWRSPLGAGFGRRVRRSGGQLRCRGGAVGPPEWQSHHRFHERRVQWASLLCPTTLASLFHNRSIRRLCYSRMDMSTRGSCDIEIHHDRIRTLQRQAIHIACIPSRRRPQLSPPCHRLQRLRLLT